MSLSHRGIAGLLAAAVLTAPVLADPGPTHNHAAPKAAPTAAKPAVKPVSLPAGVVAQVNGKNITRAEMLSTLEMLGGQPLLNQMIAAAVVEQEARRLGVSVTAAEIKKGVDEAKSSVVSQLMSQGTPMTFDEYAKRDGVTEGLLTWSVRRQLLTKKAFEKAMEAQVPSLNGQIQASHILIATVPLGGPETKPLSDDEAKKKIEGLLADIKGGKTSFADAAKQSDDKMSGAQGGSLGWFGKGMMDPTFEQTAFGLAKPGDVSAPIKSQYGYHIIRLDKIGSAATAADRAEFKKAQLAQMTANPNGVRQWMAALTQKANIVTNPRGMSSAPARAAQPAPARKAAKP